MTNTEGFETIAQMNLGHLPNDAKLLLQRQKNKFLSENQVQFGLPTSFLNEYSKRVIMRGPSIQLEQVPELIEMLQKAYEKYSGRKVPGTKSEKTNTFADMLE